MRRIAPVLAVVVALVGAFVLFSSLTEEPSATPRPAREQSNEAAKAPPEARTVAIDRPPATTDAPATPIASNVASSTGQATRVTTVRGLVIDDLGAPIANARVTCGKASASTDPRGAFAIDVPAEAPPPWKLNATEDAHLEGFGETSGEVAPPIVLVRGASLTIFVFDEVRRPVRATVRLSNASPTGYRAATNADGRATIRSRLPEGDHTVDVTAPLFAPARRKLTLAAGASSEAEVVLAPGARVEGKITSSAGEPLERANVIAVDPSGRVDKTETNHSGEYAFEGLATGRITSRRSRRARMASRP